MTKKKEEHQQQEAEEPETVEVNLKKFKQTRDEFLSTFVVIQEGLTLMVSNYIKHTNTVLGNDTSSLESVLRDLGEAAKNAADAGRSISPVKSEVDKKERKKRVHDLNAPKRPLTAFFLYMQTARPIITSDLGPGAAKGAVSDEGTRRWSAMGPADRELWSNAYKDNLKLYHARMHSYKNGNANAKTMTDDEAKDYYDEHLTGASEHAADAQLVSEALVASPDAEVEPEVEVDEEDDESEEEIAPVVVRTPTPPPKTPKVKASKKKAAKTETPVVAPVPTPTVVAAPAPESEKPDKKRKRKTKAELDKEKAAADVPVVDSIENEELQVQTPAPPKSSKPKRKKSKAAADA